MSSIFWDQVRTFTKHPSLKSQSFAYERSPQSSTPDPSHLEPGESMIWDTPSNNEDLKPAHADRLRFQNGGSIEDKPDEEGLILTTPDGVSKELSAYGYVLGNAQGYGPTPGLPTVNLKVDEQGDKATWEQSFPKEGGTVLRPVGHSAWDSSGFDGQFVVGPDGKTEALDPFGKPDKYATVRREGKAIVIEQYGQSIAISPPVPLDWVLVD